MEIVGRITADATVNTLEDERKVVHFSVAVNDRYKPKNGEVVKATTYYNCSYWINPKRAEVLKKGTLVQISGRLSLSAYIGADGTAKASLNCHVHHINIHGWPKEVEYLGKAVTPITTKENKDDLPF